MISPRSSAWRRSWASDWRSERVARMRAAKVSARSPPAFLALASATSASASRSARLGLCRTGSNERDADRRRQRHLAIAEADRRRHQRAAANSTKRPSSASTSSNMTMTPNWSPPRRASVSPGLSSRPSRRATVEQRRIAERHAERVVDLLEAVDVDRQRRRASARRAAAAWTIAASSRSKNNSRLGRPVRLSWIASCRMRSSAALISVTSASAPMTLHHVAVGVEDRARLQEEPSDSGRRRRAAGYRG